MPPAPTGRPAAAGSDGAAGRDGLSADMMAVAVEPETIPDVPNPIACTPAIATGPAAAGPATAPAAAPTSGCCK